MVERPQQLSKLKNRLLSKCLFVVKRPAKLRLPAGPL